MSQNMQNNARSSSQHNIHYGYWFALTSPLFSWSNWEELCGEHTVGCRFSAFCLQRSQCCSPCVL